MGAASVPGNGGGINFNNSTSAGAGTVSSCTVHNGYTGVSVVNGSPAHQAVLASNLIYANADHGINLNGGHNIFTNNNMYANSGNGIYGNSSSSDTFVGNNIFSNALDGLDELGSSSYDTLVANNVYLNNTSLNSEDDGIIPGKNSVMIGNYLYSNHTGQSNSGALLLLSSVTGPLWVGGGLGYTPTGSSAPDGNAEVEYFDSTANNLVLENALVNPSPGIPAANFAGTGEYLLNYSSGVLQVYGDYQFSGSTLTLNYAPALYTSMATNLKVMVTAAGTNPTFSVVSTSDTYAVSQLIMITNTGGSNWQVWGSSSGVLGTFTPNASNTPFPSASPQFYLTFSPGSSPTAGDWVDFALIAASSDTYTQKKLQFGSSATTFNKGHSKLTIASGAGFDAEGSAAYPTLIDMLAGSGTYYTFVDSGTFTVNYASITHMDANGIWLSTGASGSGPFSINNSTFDWVGNTNPSGFISTSTLITLKNVTNSTITLVNVTYGNSLANTHNFNYTILGSSTGLYWMNQQYSGGLTGSTNTQSDPTSSTFSGSRWDARRSLRLSTATGRAPTPGIRASCRPAVTRSM